MSSKHKVHKQVNAYVVPQMLKHKTYHWKRIAFFTSSERKRLKDELKKIMKYDNDN